MTTRKTYDFLRSELTRRYGTSGALPSKQPQSLRNLVSALNLWCRTLSIPSDRPIGSELAEKFDQYLGKFIEQLGCQDLSLQTIRDRKSSLRKIANLWNDFQATQTDIEDLELPAPKSPSESTRFSDGLRAAMAARQLTIRDLQSAAHVSHVTIRKWLRADVIPCKKARRSVTRCEHALGLEHGALATLITWRADRPVRRAEVAYRKKHGSYLRDRYLLKTPNDELRMEWRELLDYKTSPVVFLNRSNDAIWRVRPIEDLQPSHVTWASAVSDTGASPAAKIAWTQLMSFFGFMTLEPARQGLGRPTSSLRLAHLVDTQLAQAYVRFRQVRNGKLTNSLRAHASTLFSLLHPSDGYLTQRPDLGRKVWPGMSDADWASKCDEALQYWRKIIQFLREHGEKTRDPWEPLRSLVAQPNPLLPIFNGLERMKTYARTYPVSGYRRAAVERDLLVLRLLVANPLRANMVAMMRYRADNSGNLYRDSDGRWHLRFTKNDFKNTKGAANTDYDATVPAWVNDEITTFIDVYRPKLLSYHGDCDFVFFGRAGATRARPWQSLNNKVRQRIAEFFPEIEAPLGPHAFRHLVATAFLKQRPGEYQMVATLLHDKLKTVLENYSHLQLQDGHDRYAALVAETLEKIAA